ncbi:cyclopropane fatty acyl phospholipid synthase [soil metagenome]
MSTNALTINANVDSIDPANAAPWGIHTRDPNIIRRIHREGILGLGETYIEGGWTTSRLDELMYKVFTSPQDRLSPFVWAKWIASAIDQRLFNRNAGIGAFNIAYQHYDLGNDLFRTMLDPSMTYTSGCWANVSTLAEAQTAKLDLLCRKLNLRQGMRVLDIGCGWGNFAKYAAEHYGVHVTGITVSKEQAEEARRRCEGLPVEIRLQDYRAVMETFDRVVSIEMIEAVGRKNIGTFYRVVNRCLKDDGLFALQAITGDTCSPTSDRRFDQYILWILKYIFPDGYLPRQSELSACKGTSLRIENWESFGQDYDRTLMAWADNFANGWDGLKIQYGEAFRRRWEFYLYGCAAAFRAKLINVCQIVYSKDSLAAESF